MSTFKQGAYISLYKSSFVHDMRINVFFIVSFKICLTQASILRNLSLYMLVTLRLQKRVNSVNKQCRIYQRRFRQNPYYFIPHKYI